MHQIKKERRPHKCTHMDIQVLEILLYITLSFLSSEKIAVTWTPSAHPTTQLGVTFDGHGNKILGALASCTPSSCSQRR
uniref:Uncharacterized protein n=1 Tax=Arundo donax TaxID=35708 RepID=A0A0A9C0G2_ARUDO